MSIWSVRVDFAGTDRSPLGLRVRVASPAEALAIVKGAVREILLVSEDAGGIEYTVSVFRPGYKKGDESILAEKITLITLRP